MLLSKNGQRTGACDHEASSRALLGSPDYCESYSHRANIEGVFDNLRNTSTHNIKRSFCRVSGLVKMSLMLAFEVVAANIRLVRQWATCNKLIDDSLKFSNG